MGAGGGQTPHIPIVRPLLAWRRDDLRTIATRLLFIDDPSNTDPRHDRTHARALLAAGHLDPLALAAAAAHCREVDAALTETADWLWRARSRDADVGECRLDTTDLPRELRRRLARRAIGDVRGIGSIAEGQWSDAANIEIAARRPRFGRNRDAGRRSGLGSARNLAFPPRSAASITLIDVVPLPLTGPSLSWVDEEVACPHER
ncbi:hypothetical protein [Sphingomonas hankookensis]|uniref:hypothetical protein n=1 Tax=Sphingomonas hankookensis TaxID=563996 RepID=UPI003F7AD812